MDCGEEAALTSVAKQAQRASRRETTLAPELERRLGLAELETRATEKLGEAPGKASTREGGNQPLLRSTREAEPASPPPSPARLGTSRRIIRYPLLPQIT